jgi:fumarate reductase flavoprotein subunit
MVTKGVDTDFNKPASFLRQVPVNDRFYAFELMANATNLTGGVVINPKCEVIDEKGKPVKGLYGAGADCSGLTGFTYFSKLGGSKQMFSVYTGRTSGANAAAYARS